MIASGDAWERFEQLAAELAAAGDAAEFERVLAEYRKFVTGPLYAQLSPYMRERADREFADTLVRWIKHSRSLDSVPGAAYEVTEPREPDSPRRRSPDFPLGRIEGEPLSVQLIRERG